MDASEERDEALAQLEVRDQQIQELHSQAEQATLLQHQLAEREGQLLELQSTSQKLRLELESHLASRDAQVRGNPRNTGSGLDSTLDHDAAHLSW